MRRSGERLSLSHHPLLSPISASCLWAYDFEFDAGTNEPQQKCLNVVDQYTRESLAIDVAASIHSAKADQSVVAIDHYACRTECLAFWHRARIRVAFAPPPAANENLDMARIDLTNRGRTERPRAPTAIPGQMAFYCVFRNRADDKIVTEQSQLH